MAAWDPSPPAPRVSDADRDKVIGVLKEGSADGRLSYDTFIRRVELALHARTAGDGWVLADLGSTNGTRVNGWRAGRGFTVHPGDCVAFGKAVFRLTDRT